MKELSIEEKAYNGNYKAYTELINRLEEAKYAIKKQNYGIAMDILCKPYPDFQITTSTELAESEDERVRKALIKVFKSYQNSSTRINPYKWEGLKISEILAWLEKQGEQKQKIQPKFKIGDIIRFKGNETLKGEAEAHKIVDYDNELYVFADGATDLFCEQDLYELVEQKPAWSEEDEKHYQGCLNLMKLSLDTKPYPYYNDYLWLKSLRPQNTWKPSDEQMIAIQEAMNIVGIFTITGSKINSLYQDLKKLRESKVWKL